jgi:rhamnogalacturonan endolyase
MWRLFAGIGMLLFCTAAVAQSNDNFQKKRLLFEDNFSGAALSDLWIVETAEKGPENCAVLDGRLQLNTTGGITIWYKNKLAGNILIEYDRTVVMEGGTTDRLSDLNQFWMATDPRRKLFSRKGDFREYDSLQLYYVGMGGNDNSTTRMRRYDGKGNLQIVGEYKDSLHLLRPNKTYHIVITVKDGVSKFLVDGEEYFSFKDDKPLKEGWFAIRSTKSRQ